MVNTLDNYITNALKQKTDYLLNDLITGVLENECYDELIQCFFTSNIERELLETLKALSVNLAFEEVELNTEQDSPLLRVLIQIKQKKFVLVNLEIDRVRLSSSLLNDVRLKALKNYGCDINNVLEDESNFHINMIEEYFCDVLEGKSIKAQDYGETLGIELTEVKRRMRIDKNSLKWQYIETVCEKMKQQGYVNQVKKMCGSTDKAYQFLHKLEAVDEIKLIHNFVECLNEAKHLQFIQDAFSELHFTRVANEGVAVFEVRLEN